MRVCAPMGPQVEVGHRGKCGRVSPGDTLREGEQMGLFSLLQRSVFLLS